MIKTEIHQRICPYTGLRSFTEEESLYFKGRDSQIGQITSLLEQNKFLMVTGASGEGKSSVIYAGLIPNARAGFFKAKYTNWLVADFRPERKPLHSMATAIADKFYTQTSTVETELKRGFSSLVDLYVNSEFYVDESDENWLALDEGEKRNKKRKAANLLILVDQFEEFFTNPENFHNESPSQDSQIVVNLILETARIALKRGLPIYIVCTMRSDYIGQCSAFRGLAEYIGFSQFFVPRLKRKDLKQVIEEPAILSGNRISQRLIERLVFDLSEGIDQLPVLQHALSQIWIAAKDGMEEMDLIHYAMVGGMPADELPPENQVAFREWFLSLDEYTSDLYKETGLNKIIEIHASVLYESAYDRYTSRYAYPITRQDSKRIIALSFACLTKIDNSRAVRNRMTLGEITAIINEPTLTTEIVGSVLDIFREEDNSFIRPFKTEDASTHTLDPETVLDITHESLIRSWNKLDKWVALEFEYYSNYLDFKKQLDRWKDSDKSSSYLLPIGPLSFFENWYRQCKPNVGWINRYLESPTGLQQNKNNAGAILSDIREFLKRSARKVMVTRAFMKYGSQRIASILAICIMLMLSGFYWYNAVQKQNANVIERIKKEAQPLLTSEYVNSFDKGFYLITEERLKKGSLMSHLNSQENIQARAVLGINSYLFITLLDKKLNNPVKHDLIGLIKKDLETLNSTDSDLEFLLNQHVQFILELAYDNYYNPGGRIEETLKFQSSALYDLIIKFFKNPRLYKVSVSAKLNQAIQLWLTFGDAQPEKIKTLIDLISPLGNGVKMFSVYYVQGSFEPNGIRPLDFNGGYHMLASLYAAIGMPDEVIKCFEILKKQNDYFSDRVFNNFTNVIGYLYQFGNHNQVNELIHWITNNTSRSEESIYDELINRSGYLSILYRVNYDFGGFTEEGTIQLNLCLGSAQQLESISDDYESVVGKIRDASERNFLLARHFKRRAIYGFKNQYDRGLTPAMDYFDSLFSKSVRYFLLVDEKYLSNKVSITYPLGAGIRTKEWTRRESFVYPDHIGGWMNFTYHTDIFLNYLKKKGLLDEFYKTSNDLNMIHYWLTNAFEVRPFYEFEHLANRFKLSDSVLLDILSYTSNHAMHESFDKNLILLILTNRNFEKGDTLEGMRYFRLINFETTAQWVHKYEEIHASFLLNQMRYLCANLAVAGRHRESVQIAEKFQNADEKVFAYLYSAKNAYKSKQYSSSFVLFDSAFSKASKIPPIQILGARDFRFDFISFSAEVGGEKVSSIGNRILKEFNEGRKFGGIYNMINGYASTGNFYKALTYMPATLTENQDLVLKTLVLSKAASAENANNDYLNVLDTYSNWSYVLYGNVNN